MNLKKWSHCKICYGFRCYVLICVYCDLVRHRKRRVQKITTFLYLQNISEYFCIYLTWGQWNNAESKYISNSYTNYRFNPILHLSIFSVSGNDMFRLILMNDLTLLHLARTLPAWNIQECSTPLCLYNYAMLTKTINLKCTKMQHVALIKRATLSDASKMP